MNNPKKTDAIQTPTPAALNTTDIIIVRGIHLELTPALQAAAINKASRLLRHQARVVRIRIDIEHGNDIHAPFIAKGHIEIGGPDIIVSFASEDAYKSLDLLVDRLDRVLRERSRAHADTRNNPNAVEEPEGIEPQINA